MERCPWCLGNEKMIRYHDEEWGVPVHDDQKQFEFLMMEVMQCGLNWNMMIQKREIFRECFDNFDFDKVSWYSREGTHPPTIRISSAKVSYPRCYIYRKFFQTPIADWGVRTNGCTSLFCYTVLCFCANFRTSYLRLDGNSHAIYPSE